MSFTRYRMNPFHIRIHFRTSLGYNIGCPFVRLIHVQKPVLQEILCKHIVDVISSCMDTFLKTALLLCSDII